MDAILFTREVIEIAALSNGMRTGQSLFISLPRGATLVVAEKLWDPFFYEWDWNEIYEWCQNHLIFGQSDIIAVFDGDTILWQQPDISTPTGSNNGI